MPNGAMAEEQVVAFLAGRHSGPVEALERLAGGWWSSAWGYRVGDTSGKMGVWNTLQ